MPSEPTSPKSNLRWAIVAAAALLVVALGVVAVVASSGGDAEDSSPTTTESTDTPVGDSVSISGSLPAFPDAPTAPDPAVGEQLPEVKGVDLTGSPVGFGPADGAQVIVVGAHWCPHCNEEIPKIIEWLESPDAPSVPFTVVSTAADSNGPNYPPSEWLDELGWTGATVADSDDAAISAALGTTGFPYVIVVDANGDVTARFSGSGSMDQLVAAVAAVES